VSIVAGFALVFTPNRKRTTAMKDGIHPKYVDSVVTCGCGNTFNTRSTRPKITVEVCSKCHPFFTGSVKFVDAAGRVDKFNKKFGGTYGKAKKAAEAAKA
jgi:large subunit ribosomal protein L31